MSWPASAGGATWWRGSARHVPSRVIAELVGVPVEDRVDLCALIETGFDFSVPEPKRLAAGRAVAGYLEGLVTDGGKQTPDGPLAHLIGELGHELRAREIAGIAATVLQGGYETSAAMISGSVFALLTRQSASNLLGTSAGTDELIEELLRYLSVVQIIPPRRVRRDTVLGGHRLAVGELVMVSLPAANHDPDVYERPEELRPGREEARHLAFGHGVHRCVGSALARLDLKPADVDLDRGTVRIFAREGRSQPHRGDR
jgi:cytochrome P450